MFLPSCATILGFPLCASNVIQMIFWHLAGEMSRYACLFKFSGKNSTYAYYMYTGVRKKYNT